jgi:hypothetical protein
MDEETFMKYALMAALVVCVALPSGRGGEITINSKEVFSVQGNTLTIDTTRTTNHDKTGRGPTCDKSVSARHPLVSCLEHSAS